MGILRLGIDAGHGGTDLGKVVAIGGDLVFVEKDLNLKLAIALRAAMGPLHLLSRAGDETLKPRERAARLNSADLVLSIHHDSGANGSVNGTRFYAMSPAGLRAASALSNALKETKRASRVIIPAEDTYPRVLTVLRRFMAPTVLVEVGFLTNVLDRGYVSNEWPGFVDAISRTLKGLNFI